MENRLFSLERFQHARRFTSPEGDEMPGGARCVWQTLASPVGARDEREAGVEKQTTFSHRKPLYLHPLL